MPLAQPFAFGLGGGAPVPPEGGVPIDHVAGAVARIVQQLKGKPKFLALLTALVNPMQDLELAMIALLVNRWVETAVGVQLDAIGKLVGQARDGLYDEDYRRYIRARVATNRSNGTAEDILRITGLVIDFPAMTAKLTTEGIAASSLLLLNVLPSANLATILTSFLRQAASAGVKIVLETSTAVDSDSFTTAIAAFTSGSASIGATHIDVDSTAGFPASGSLDIDIGLAVYELVTYTGITATSFLGVSPLAHNHVASSAVQLAGGPGKGYGDSVDATVGGKLEDARSTST